MLGRHRSSMAQNSQSILPLKVTDTRRPSPRRSRILPRRYTRLLISALGAAAFVFILFFRNNDEPLAVRDDAAAEYHQFPPLYDAYHEYERHLPQHNLSLPYPEGRDAKFFFPANHVIRSGWGNALQEIVVNAHLAYVSKRAFVFDNYTWDRDGPDFSEYNGRLIPSRIPLSSMISGPIIGAPLPEGDDVPRSVSREYFKEICPNPVVMDTIEINQYLRLDDRVPATEIFDRWVEKLNSIENPCVEIEKSAFQIFEIWVFGTKRILSLWPSLSKSPMLTRFSWSPLVLKAFADNEHLLSPPAGSHWQLLPSYFRTSTLPLDTIDVIPRLTPAETHPIPGLLVLHIRRGDFKEHCQNLARWHSDWNGFNSFASLPDKFLPPVDEEWGTATEETMQMYLKTCYPTIKQITERIKEVVADAAANAKRNGEQVQELKRVYIMTNGGADWIDELKVAIMGIKQWDAVVSSRDITLSWEAKYIAQAVDMLIGQRAQVFIGNGFSSLTSNIVMLRMLRELPPDTNRFW